MLFSTPIFVIGFLPVTLAGFLFCGRYAGRQMALAWLFAASLLFYAWWNFCLLPLLIASISVNFCLARQLHGANGKAWLIAGLTFNLSLLVYFKYAMFLIGLLGHPGALGTIILPLGVSFFTFQQIMFLVDGYKGDRFAGSFLEYGCFIAFFPHVIAGPIVRPRDIIPQFQCLQPLAAWPDRLVDGAELFLLGLAKKLVLADSLARFADSGFAAAAQYKPLTLIEAWVALLAYGLQIYFDFSGYSDMAIGLARMFGIHFPVNFISPYKAKNISEFWRCWNVTLSGFLRDYLYIPLGGNRRGEGRRVFNLMLTMGLAGLWHGAAMRFLLWGALHGIFLVIHRWFRRSGAKMPAAAAWALTISCVLLAWVPFRAASFAAAGVFYAGLAGFHGIAAPEIFIKMLPFSMPFVRAVPVLPYLGDARTLSLPQGVLLLALGWFVVLALPASQSMGRQRRGVALVASFAFSLQALFFAPYSLPFVYFQF
jgi:D-alanyl-lipoteichoic acid acyltransferase DltB (MBOAT superfamily)